MTPVCIVNGEVQGKWRYSSRHDPIRFDGGYVNGQVEQELVIPGHWEDADVTIGETAFEAIAVVWDELRWETTFILVPV